MFGARQKKQEENTKAVLKKIDDTRTETRRDLLRIAELIRPDGADVLASTTTTPHRPRAPRRTMAELLEGFDGNAFQFHSGRNIDEAMQLWWLGCPHLLIPPLNKVERARFVVVGDTKKTKHKRQK